VQPLVESVKVEYAKLDTISNNDLRQRTIDLKARITARIKDEQARSRRLRAEIEADPEMDIHAARSATSRSTSWKRKW
jgi:preprotein translocase subunit SecA